MTLDALWGVGASNDVATAFSTAKAGLSAGEVTNPDQSVSVTVKQAGVTILIAECRTDLTVQVVYLATECSSTLAERESNHATSLAINAKIVPVLKKYGIGALKAQPLDATTKAGIQATGGYQDDDGKLKWNL